MATKGTKSLALMILAIGVLVAGWSEAYASPRLHQDQKEETPRELTDEEYLKDIEQFYESHPDLVIIVDLANPNGIDPSLLPEDLKNLAESGVRIVAYRETVHVEQNGGKPNGLACPVQLPTAGIGCATNSGSRDLTTSTIFGSVTQFSRVIALRYDWYSACPNTQNCFGWEIEKQYMWWKRSNSTWNVKNGMMRTYFGAAENYCTEAGTSLNYISSTIAQPTWSGNQTSTYSISGFPNTAYVPVASNGQSYTQGDIYQGTTLKTDNAKNYQSWPLYN